MEANAISPISYMLSRVPVTALLVVTIWWLVPSIISGVKLGYAALLAVTIIGCLFAYRNQWANVVGCLLIAIILPFAILLTGWILAVGGIPAGNGGIEISRFVSGAWLAGELVVFVLACRELFSGLFTTLARAPKLS